MTEQSIGRCNFSNNLKELLRLSKKLEAVMCKIMRRSERKLNDDYNGF